MNRFFILALIAALCGSGALHAQDIITLKSGEDIRAIVTRVSSNEVSFKKYDNPQGGTYVLKTSEIYTIKYENGNKDTFNAPPAQSRQYGSQQQYGNQQQNRDQQQYGTQQQYRNKPSGWRKFTIGLSFPKGDLDNDNKIGVGKGLGIGLKSYSSLETTLRNLSLVYGAELYYHGWSSDTKEKREKPYGNNADFTYPMYFNLPITIGGNYMLPLPNTNTTIYGELAAGLNVSYITKWKIESSSSSYEYKSETSYDPAFDFCYGLEAGIVLNNKFHIGVRYNNLGTYKYKYETSITTYTQNGSTNPDPTKGKTPKWELKNTVLVLGIRF